MAIRRPPTTFSDTISTADIADDAITGGKLANDIAISTTGNIVTTGSGALTVAGNTTLSGTNNLGSNPTVTLGTNTTFPTGHVVQVKCAYDADQASYSFSSTSQAITNLKCNITPKSASNTMFVHGHFYVGNNTNYTGGFGLKRRLASVVKNFNSLIT